MPSRFFRVPLGEIGYLRAIVDGYDGLAVVRSLSASRGEVEWIVGEGLEEEADALARRLAGEIDLQPIARPDDWPPLESAGDEDRAPPVGLTAFDTTPGIGQPLRAPPVGLTAFDTTPGDWPASSSSRAPPVEKTGLTFFEKKD